MPTFSIYLPFCFPPTVSFNTPLIYYFIFFFFFLCLSRHHGHVPFSFDFTDKENGSLTMGKRDGLEKRFGSGGSASMYARWKDGSMMNGKRDLSVLRNHSGAFYMIGDETSGVFDRLRRLEE